MRYLIVRIGAYGDALITTPLIHYLKEQGNEVYYLMSERAEQMLRYNSNIDKAIIHPENSVENDNLGEYFEQVRVDNDCDKLINLCESIEVRLAVLSDYPQWNWTKEERKAYCNRNYYEYTFEHAGFGQIERVSYLPEMFFTKEEEDYILQFRKRFLGQKIVMWGLSGSGRQKTYPYVPYIVGDLVRDFKDVVVILVGGEGCKILECGFPNHKRILKMSGEFNMRQSALMAKYASLVISPDTGFLHCAGCWDTPKIGLLTHSTIENITKHFKNDYSIESTSVCAPCFRLITNAEVECLHEKGTKACLCMSKEHMKPEVIYNRIKEVLNGRFEMPGVSSAGEAVLCNS